MPGAFTAKPLDDVKDSAPEFGFDGTQEARFATGDLDARDTGISLHRVKPGCRQGMGHRHENAEEVYVVIGGSGRAKLDDEIIELKRLDAIRVSPEVTRAFEAGDEGLELIAVGPRHEGDGEVLPGWWSE